MNEVLREKEAVEERLRGAEAERDEAKGLPTDSEVCDSCGLAVAIVWAAKDEDWRKLVGGPGGILCPKCFDDRAMKRLGGVFAYIAVPLADGWRVDWYGYKAQSEQRRKALTFAAKYAHDRGQHGLTFKDCGFEVCMKARAAIDPEEAGEKERKR